MQSFKEKLISGVANNNRIWYYSLNDVIVEADEYSCFDALLSELMKFLSNMSSATGNNIDEKELACV
jgi:hypothetical protein